MKKIVLSLVLFLMWIPLSAVYQVGDIVNDISFTAHYSNGDSLQTSIYEQVDAGKPVMIFFGEAG